ncbi:MAG: hypothetical protein AAFY56_19875, partial [Pseudomonadota bacterium]
MAVITHSEPRPGVRWRTTGIGVLGAVVAAVVGLSLMLGDRPGWLQAYPSAWTVDLATPLTDGLKFLARDFDAGCAPRRQVAHNRHRRSGRGRRGGRRSIA